MGYSQQLQINEVATSNKTIQDEDGDTPDWIELYNPSPDTIFLKDYALSDDILEPRKWVFEEGFVPPLGFFSVYASDKDSRRLSANYDVIKNDMSSLGWAYADSGAEKPGTSVVNPTIFSNSVFGLIDNKPVVAGEIYYGEPGDLGYSYAGVHMKVEDWDLAVDRSMYDQFKLLLYLEEGKKCSIRFSQEGLEDWKNHGVQLTGRGDTSWYNVPITGTVGGLDLSVFKGITVEAFEGFNTSFEFILFEAQFSSSVPSRLHTNFKLSSAGESVYLSNPNEGLSDLVDVPALKDGFSYARVDEGDTWSVVDLFTPNKANGGRVIKGFCNDKISYSLSSGFYDKGEELVLTGASEIRYTTDGSVPNLNSSVYTAPLALDSTIVVKAACFNEGKLPIEIAVNTYFVDYTTKLPVWSLSTSPEAFFDPDSGIYVLGNDYDTVNPYFGANFWQDWERPVTVEFFEDDGQLAFVEDCGVKIFGNWSKANPKKSLSLHFRKEYGNGRLNYPLYPDHPNLKSFNSLILRGSGGDEAYLHFRDGFNAELIQEADFETQKFRPSVVFINGAYWGLHNIREKVNDDYFEENYGIDKEDVDMIVGFYGTESGENTSFVQFMQDVRADKLSYTEMKDVVDINSFIDYYAYEIYINNKDWPSNNMKYWRQRSTNGKWRWFMYDTDMSTAIYSDPGTQYDYNSFERAINFEEDVFWPTSDESTLLLRKLIEIPEFVEAFVNRYCDLINTTLNPTNVLTKLQEKVLDKIDDEVILNRERWNLSQEAWPIYVEEYKEFWNERPAYARQHMQEVLSLSGEVKLIVKNNQTDAGYVTINSVSIDDAQWDGVYFSNIPVCIEAHAYPGFSFEKWESTLSSLNNNLNATIEDLLLDQDVSITPVFRGSASPTSITLSEFNFHSNEDLNTGDWLEFHNYGDVAIDLSAWIVRDGTVLAHYKFPSGTVLGAGDYLVVAEDPAAFALHHPKRSVLGPLKFKLSNSSDQIRLFNHKNELMQRMTYTDEWSAYADGEGGTMELVSSDADISQASSWASACLGGSPYYKYDPTCPVNLSADEINIDENHVYPNPASDFVYLDASILENAEEIRLYSVDGQFVKALDFEGVYEVNDLMNGFYTIVVAYSTSTQNYSLIIQK